MLSHVGPLVFAVSAIPCLFLWKITCSVGSLSKEFLEEKFSIGELGRGISWFEKINCIGVKTH